MGKEAQVTVVKFQLEQKEEYKDPASIKQKIAAEKNESERKLYQEMNEQYPDLFPKLYQIKDGIGKNLPEGYSIHIRAKDGKEPDVFVRDGKNGGYCFLADGRAVIYNSREKLSADDVHQFSGLIKDAGIKYDEQNLLTTIERNNATNTQTAEQTQAPAQPTAEETTAKANKEKAEAITARLNTIRGNPDASDGKLEALRNQAEALGSAGAQAYDAAETMLRVLKSRMKQGKGSEKGFEFGRTFFHGVPCFKLYPEDSKLLTDPFAVIRIQQKDGQDEFSYKMDKRKKGEAVSDEVVAAICDTMAACKYNMVDVRDIPKEDKDKFMVALVRRGIVPTGATLDHNKALGLLGEAKKTFGKNEAAYDAFEKRFNRMMKYSLGGALTDEELNSAKKGDKDNEKDSGKSKKMKAKSSQRE